MSDQPNHVVVPMILDATGYSIYAPMICWPNCCQRPLTALDLRPATSTTLSWGAHRLLVRISRWVGAGRTCWPIWTNAHPVNRSTNSVDQPWLLCRWVSWRLHRVLQMSCCAVVWNIWVESRWAVMEKLS